MRPRLHLLAAPFAIAALVLPSPPTVAHHSFAMFDQTKEVQLHGVVREFQWTNPHVWVEIQVEGSGHKPAQWSIEASSPNSLMRHGWTSKSLAPGDPVTVSIHPLRTGAPGGSLIRLTLRSGAQLVN